MSRKQFTILVSIPLKPGRADEFLALLNDVFDAMEVEDTFVNATALRSADDPDTIMLFETWLDRENFMSEQMKRPYRELYEARLPELLRTPREVSFYEPIRRMP
jgi:quinol monooxygenase YgiN